ncbi:MAG: 16S rRNA (guanine(527)-N(7))-methyltransferase RsmG [Acidobacteria bacterium]|jgi:16S rRNA (guanine527-N7)-methyltransferase|nr:MAG: 16S rRNA (guanine(527)-N(7))-methyltransferase RsmG [Acidobacteriota bacterium]
MSEEQIRSFSVYLTELQRWNRVHNITAIEEDRDIVIRHFLDSLTPTLCLREKGVNVEGLSFCDVGSGAGFPGVPLKIYYGNSIKLTLVESQSKKCSFLEFIKVKLGLDYRVLCTRAESLKETFDVVLCRALGPLKEIIPILDRLSRRYVLVMKGKEAPEGYDYCKVDLPDIKDSYILFLAKST